jgi:hypothetical protein
MSDLLKSQILTMFGTFSLVVGIGMCGYAFYKLYEHSRDPISHSFEGALWTFFVGVAFVSLNSVLKAMFSTLGVNTKIGISYTTGTGGSEQVAAKLVALENLAFVIGIGFFLKALLMLRRAETQAQAGAGVVTLIAAVLIANPGWFAATVLTTLGGK